MLEALATLLVFQTVGEVLSYGLRLPVPGPVLGMASAYVTISPTVWNTSSVARACSIVFVRELARGEPLVQPLDPVHHARPGAAREMGDAADVG